MCDKCMEITKMCGSFATNSGIFRGSLEKLEQSQSSKPILGHICTLLNTYEGEVTYALYDISIYLSIYIHRCAYTYKLDNLVTNLCAGEGFLPSL